MLEERTLNSILNLGGDIIRKGVIGSKEGSLVHELVSNLDTTGLIQKCDEIEDTSLIKEVEDTVTPDEMEKGYILFKKDIIERFEDSNDSSGEYREAVNLMTRAVMSLGDIVKNTVNPHIRKVLESIETYNDNLNYNNDETGLIIKEEGLPAIFSVPAVEKLITHYRNLPRLNNDSRIILELRKRSNSKEDLEKIATLLGGDFEWDWWAIEEILSGGANYLDENVNIKAFLLVYLNTLEMPSEGIAITLDKWTAGKEMVCNALAKELNKVIDRYQQALNTNNLYPYNDSTGKLGGSVTNKTIRVHSAVYRSIIASGSTPEAILGNEILGRKYTARTLIDPEVITICENSYALHLKTQKVTRSKNEHTHKWKNINEALTYDLESIAENGQWPVDGDTRDKAIGRLRSVISKVRASSARDESTEDIVAAIICTTWYAHTDAWRLLDIAGRLLKEDEELNTDDAFTLAKIEYVAKFLADSLTYNIPKEKDKKDMSGAKAIPVIHREDAEIVG